ncbi:GlmU family protein [Flavobacteriales bacterium]|jgi:UDP-N-acetylglucosamine diphosphorylase/glucosamine-1-phosphate N-acetyltransferase|nr:GlmU family protein [Flavobacteriales bacterium]MDB9701906.1 GlmU family protein [Flavobacteriales bacterium]MDB9931801.1 GlmU family protein [Flavobacteriales bacterium]MDG1175732.1 GlmU family protein [Flavobacteriales bacterium]
MNIILFDGIYHKNLLPLTYTRPVCELRIGILTIKEKWEHYIENPIQVKTQDYLSKKFGSATEENSIGINGSILPSDDLMSSLLDLKNKQILTSKGKVIAINPLPLNSENIEEALSEYKMVETKATFLQVENVWDLFKLNDEAIRADIELIKSEKTFVEASSTNQILGEDIYIEEGAKVECAILNTTSGPIYIAKGAEVMEGSILRGPIAVCENGVVKMGAKIYGATTIGPYSKVGGEVNNCMIQGYSNKGHDGFLGNAVLGEWCNLGADTNNSNLKNNYQSVDIYNYNEEKYVDTELQFCGLIMGDHSKSAINTMFNTGTVIGVSANIYGADFPSKFIPSYSWGGRKPLEYKFDKAMDTAKRVMDRRSIALTENDLEILKHVYDESQKFRK